MKKLLIILFFGFCPVIGMSQSGCHIFGKIKFVQFGGDYKVRMVGISPNLKVKYVSYGASTQGNWQIVDFEEDYKIELVQAGEDFSVQIVDFGQGCN